jgi:hypothetical protein
MLPASARSWLTYSLCHGHGSRKHTIGRRGWCGGSSMPVIQALGPFHNRTKRDLDAGDLEAPRMSCLYHRGPLSRDIATGLGREVESEGRRAA